jgi:hypothetical protein
LRKRSQAYRELGEKFEGITKIWSLTSHELEEEGRKLQAIFKDDLEPALCDELQHLKSHITECSIGLKVP